MEIKEIMRAITIMNKNQMKKKIKMDLMKMKKKNMRGIMKTKTTIMKE